ncbi:MAG: H4MPT-linked C1 transfer pathway protein, partial [Burkholderiaceae bacterium]
MPERAVIGWDVGGAHVKACLMQRGEVVDVAQWACPLWHGLDRLAPVIEAARSRWQRFDAAQHAVTMTGEMVDLFADREDGVRRIATELTRSIRKASTAPDPVRFFAGDAGWLRS